VLGHLFICSRRGDSPTNFVRGAIDWVTSALVALFAKGTLWVFPRSLPVAPLPRASCATHAPEINGLPNRQTPGTEARRTEEEGDELREQITASSIIPSLPRTFGFCPRRLSPVSERGNGSSRSTTEQRTSKEQRERKERCRVSPYHHEFGRQGTRAVDPPGVIPGGSSVRFGCVTV
jgi:hypothetical protein